MIVIHDTEGRASYIATHAIASISETGASSQWHGTRAILRTKDGKDFECRESAQEINAMINEETVADGL